MLPSMRSQILVLTLSMVSELSASRVMALLVLHGLPRQGACRGYVRRPGKDAAGGDSACPLLFVPCLECCLGSLVFCLLLLRQALPQVWL